MLRYANSELSIPEIARELNVETVLEGSVRYAANRVRITAQLIDARTDEHLWSEVYERDFADIFAIQSDIAMNIANALQAEFSLEEQANLERAATSSPEAYSLYLQALSIPAGNSAPAESRAAVLDLLNKALAIDPNFALAYVRIAHQMLVYGEMTTRGLAESQALARENAERALDLDPSLGAAYVVIARTHMLNRDAASAQQAFDRAIELGPNNPTVLSSYAMFNAYIGNYATAISLATRAVALDGTLANLGGVLIFAGEYQRATKVYEDILVRSPLSGIAHFELSRLASRRGDFEKAIEHMRNLERRLPPNAGSMISAYAYGLAGSRAGATRLFNLDDDLTAGEAYVSETIRALGYLSIGDNEKALEHLKNAAANPRRDLAARESAYIRVNSFADPVLEQPEFVEVRKGFAFTGLEEIN
jgi:Tfp pilus assembly protein PilF